MATGKRDYFRSVFVVVTNTTQQGIGGLRVAAFRATFAITFVA
jgi:hypothetical protein